MAQSLIEKLKVEVEKEITNSFNFVKRYKKEYNRHAELLAQGEVIAFTYII